MTLSEKITFELQKIRPELMRGDFTDCAISVGRTKETVSRYVGGDVRHVGTGIKILNFFKKRIAEREKQLK